MVEGSAVDSLRFALGPELIKLYVVIALGWFIIDFSRHGFVIIENPFLRSLISLPIYLCGLALVVGGLVGVLHRVLSDTTLAGEYQ